MVSKCANPNCSERFLRLGDGRLFRWDGVTRKDRADRPGQNTRGRRAEFFWLCGDCARRMTVVFTAEVGVTVKPIAEPTQSATEAAKVSEWPDTPRAGHSSESATSRQTYAFRRAAG